MTHRQTVLKVVHVNTVLRELLSNYLIGARIPTTQQSPTRESYKADTPIYILAT